MSRRAPQQDAPALAPGPSANDVDWKQLSSEFRQLLLPGALEPTEIHASYHHTFKKVYRDVVAHVDSVAWYVRSLFLLSLRFPCHSCGLRMRFFLILCLKPSCSCCAPSPLYHHRLRHLWLAADHRRGLLHAAGGDGRTSRGNNLRARHSPVDVRVRFEERRRGKEPNGETTRVLGSTLCPTVVPVAHPLGRVSALGCSEFQRCDIRKGVGSSAERRVFG